MTDPVVPAREINRANIYYGTILSLEEGGGDIAVGNEDDILRPVLKFEFENRQWAAREDDEPGSPLIWVPLDPIFRNPKPIKLMARVAFERHIVNRRDTIGIWTLMSEYLPPWIETSADEYRIEVPTGKDNDDGTPQMIEIWRGFYSPSFDRRIDYVEGSFPKFCFGCVISCINGNHRRKITDKAEHVSMFNLLQSAKALRKERPKAGQQGTLTGVART